MCKAFEDEREESLRQSISKLMENLKLTSRQAMEALGIPQNEWEKYKQI